jgi:transcriptional regulator with XRE-family HTH domain
VTTPKNGLLVAIMPAQIRGARAMLDWTREQLSAASQVPFRTLTRIEAGMVERPHAKTLRAIRDALTAAGIEFIDGDGDGPGVRFTREAAIRMAVERAKGDAGSGSLPSGPLSAPSRKRRADAKA